MDRNPSNVTKSAVADPRAMLTGPAGSNAPTSTPQTLDGVHPAGAQPGTGDSSDGYLLPAPVPLVSREKSTQSVALLACPIAPRLELQLPSMYCQRIDDQNIQGDDRN